MRVLNNYCDFLLFIIDILLKMEHIGWEKSHRVNHNYKLFDYI